MKRIIFCYILTFLSINLNAQTYEVRRVNGRSSTDLSEHAAEIGRMQHEMQKNYDYNYQRVSDKCDNIYLIFTRLTKRGNLQEWQYKYIRSYGDNLKIIYKSDFTSNVQSTKIMSYLRTIENEMSSW